MHLKYPLLLLSLFISLLHANGQKVNIMPMPSSIQLTKEQFRLNQQFSISIHGETDPRLYKEASRFTQRLAERTGLFFKTWIINSENNSPTASLMIHSDKKGVVQIEMEESYEVQVNVNGITINAVSDIGAIRALETLLQLIESDKDGFYIPGTLIKDKPRFAWRGLLISQPYHFMPMEVIKRTLDAMALVKMNVLHLYISDDQAYTIESKVFPRLHELVSNGQYFTHEQVREIISYADQRGIRVVPEIDLPGHSTAILTAFPELASIKRAYTLQDHWGVFDPTIDPTKESTYVFLDSLLTEVASLFPDHYFHIGGDENTGNDWAKNDTIQAFMKANGLSSTVALQNYFNRHIQKILNRSKKITVGWDEILMKKMDDSLAKSYFEKGEFNELIEQDVPKDIVVQSWRGMEALLSSAKNGYKSILSKGYYIDLMQPTSYHYLNDPIPYLNTEIIPDSEADLNRFESEIIKKIEKGEKIITAEEEKLIIGGEATMWTEHASSETIDSRIWPRTAAIAERLWSPSTIRDVSDMYKRMDNISILLESVGSTHIKNREMMLRRLAGTEHIEALKNIIDFIEPVKGYKRNEADNFTKYSPYTLMVDIAIADSKSLREFNKLVDTLLKSSSHTLINQLSEQLISWQSSCQTIRNLAKNNPSLSPILVHAESLATISTEALKLLDMKKKKITPNKTWTDNFFRQINEANKVSGYCELMVGDGFKKLVNLQYK